MCCLDRTAADQSAPCCRAKQVLPEPSLTGRLHPYEPPFLRNMPLPTSLSGKESKTMALKKCKALLLRPDGDPIPCVKEGKHELHAALWQGKRCSWQRRKGQLVTGEGRAQEV